MHHGCNLLALLLLLCLAPSLFCSASAQPAPPPRTVLPDALFHGLLVSDCACDPLAPVLYAIDGLFQVVAFNTTTGRQLPWTYRLPSHHYAEHLVVDLRHQVYLGVAVSGSTPEGSSAVIVLDSQLRPLQNRSLDALKPPGAPTQLVHDSGGYVYLFSDSVYHGFNPTVWVLEPRKLVQVDAWPAPIPNNTAPILAVDSEDTLYFQLRGGDRRTILTSTGGDTIATLDLFAGQAPPSQSSWVADIAVDSALSIYLAPAYDPFVYVFDSSGRPLSRLPLLSGGPSFAVPRVSFTSTGRLLVSDPLPQLLLSVSPTGAIERSMGSAQASTAGINDLSQDPRTGDLLVGYYYRGAGVIAERVSARDGSLLQSYALPEAARQVDYASLSMDVGEQTSRLYFLFMDRRGRQYRVHVLQPSGRLQAEFALEVPGDAYALRVDEWAGRIHVAVESRIRGSPTTVYAFDLQGRPLFNVSLADPPLGHLSDLVLASGPNGAELILLDTSNSRLVAVGRNGSVSTFPTPSELPSTAVLNDMEYAGNGDVYISYTDFVYNGTQWLSSTSAIVRVDRQGRVVDRFVAGPGWEGSRFNAISARGDDLYANDNLYDVIFVWRNRQPHAQLPVSAARKQAESAEPAQGQQQGRHAVMAERLLRGGTRVKGGEEGEASAATV